MSRDKQIEEMARIICKPTAKKGNCDKCGFKKQCSKFDDATDLYNAGYRKASEVAAEIFGMLREDLRGFVDLEYLERLIKIYEKKYTEGGE